jgi:membrane protease YdiL (CAAX protease family)
MSEEVEKKDPMKTFAIRRPFLFGLLVALIGILSQMWPLWRSGLSQSAQILLARVSGIVIAVFLLTWFNWWQEAGFARFHSWKTLLPYLPLILLVLLGFASLIETNGINVTDPGLILFGAVSFLAGGFMEEALFRGVILRAFLPRRLLSAALLSAVVFSLSHLPNLLFGQDLGTTMMQLVRAFLVGFAFVAPLAYTRNIWPLIILHALINFSSFLSSGNITLISTESPTMAQVLSEVTLFGLMSGYGYWLLHRAEQRSKGNVVIIEQAYTRLSR